MGQVQSMDTRVGIVCGSRSDFPVMDIAVEILGRLGVGCEMHAISAHRAPELLSRFMAQAEQRGIGVFIAAAGGAAHLPGVVASRTIKPVIGVPIPTPVMGGLDSLLSIVQMPKGIPVATVAIGGAENAALLAAEILAVGDPELRARLTTYREAQTAAIEADESNADLMDGPAAGDPTEPGESIAGSRAGGAGRADGFRRARACRAAAPMNRSGAR